jgi:hypothetical protein
MVVTTKIIILWNVTPCSLESVYMNIADELVASFFRLNLIGFSCSRQINAGIVGSVVGWGNMLQAGRLRVRFFMKSLHFPIDLILQAALWP